MAPDGAFCASSSPWSGACSSATSATAKEWFPHELVPWSRGRDFDAGEEWDPDDSAITLDDGRAQRAVREPPHRGQPPVLLPRHRRRCSAATARGASGPGGGPPRRAATRSSSATTSRSRRAIDPVALERGRMARSSKGEVPGRRRGRSTASSTSRCRSSPPASRTATPASCSTTRSATRSWPVSRPTRTCHHLFYRDLASAALEIDPSAMVIAIEHQVRTFEMPGTGIPDFDAHAQRIARAGIYDFPSTTTRSSCRSCCATGRSPR